MLLELAIKNFAIIEDLRVEFDNGLNVLTGETGSGKSIIIDALTMVLGGRMSKDIIKTGKDSCYIEAVFSNDTDIEEFKDDELIIISKEIKRDRPSITKVNNKTVNNNFLFEISSNLINIFAQHDSISLMSSLNQKKLIDSLIGDSHLENLKSLDELISILHRLEREFEEKNTSINNRERELDLLIYQINEIEDANLTEDDEENLEDRYRYMLATSDIIEELNKSLYLLKSNYDSVSISDMIDKVVSSLIFITKYDSSFESYVDELEDIKYRLKDVSSELESHLDGIDGNLENLNILEERLNLVNTLKRKYAPSVEGIYKILDELVSRKKFLENFETEILKLENEIKELRKKAYNKALEISNSRKEIAKKLEERIKNELTELSIKNAKFKVDFKEKPLSNDGIDNLDFLISTNAGEEFKSLSKTASGGEMSRIMLGFKSIIAEKSDIKTLVFDEIDTGISGRTAEIVGNKIKKLSKTRQVIAISHLPQIVSLADSHYVIEKTEEENTTFSTIKKLSEDERVMELARLIGGLKVTEDEIKVSRELLRRGRL